MPKYTVHVFVAGSALIEVDIESGDCRYIKRSAPTTSAVVLHDSRDGVVSDADTNLACGMASTALASSVYETLYEETDKHVGDTEVPAGSKPDNSGMKN